MLIENLICGIYKITNKINGKYYIGSSKNIQLNWIIHTLNYINKEQHPLYEEMNQYGINNFDFSILEICPEKLLEKNLRHYQTIFQTDNIDYNHFEPPYLKNAEKILRPNIEIKNYEIINKLIPPLSMEYDKIKNEYIIYSKPDKTHRQIQIKENNNTCGIYKITNKLTKKAYIGQSKNIYNRWEEHKTQSKNKMNNAPLYKDMRKYTIQNFKFEILEECDLNKLNEKEIYYIEKYNTIQPNGYNIRKGGKYLRK